MNLNNLKKFLFAVLLVFIAFLSGIGKKYAQVSDEKSLLTSDDNLDVDEKMPMMCYRAASISGFGNADRPVQNLLTDYKNDGVIDQETYDKAKELQSKE